MLNKKHKASILAVSMIILGIVLTTALSISIVSLKERKASIGLSHSNQAYKSADSGIELVMDAILTTRVDSAKTGSDLGSCSAGTLTGSGYKVKLKKDDGSGGYVMASCADKLIDIVAIKSVGTDGNTQRAIEAAVAASGGPGSWNCTIRSKSSASNGVAALCQGLEKAISGGCYATGSGNIEASAAGGIFDSSAKIDMQAWSCKSSASGVFAFANCCE